MFIEKALKKEIKTIYYKEYADNFTLEEFMKQLKNIKKSPLKEFVHDLKYGESGNFQSDLARELNDKREKFGTLCDVQCSKQPKLMELFNLLGAISMQVYLVGGSVRDSIFEKVPKDFDVVTDIPYDTLTKILKDDGYTIMENGKQFLVLVAKKGDLEVEIANFRRDGTYSDGRRPEFVDIGTIMDDSERRDFTINALYYSPIQKKLLDPTGLGVMDVDKRVLRFVGKPDERMKEDKLRAWRFMRFLNKFNLTPDKKSSKAIKSDFDNIMKNSTPARVLQELTKFINF